MGARQTVSLNGRDFDPAWVNTAPMPNYKFRFVDRDGTTHEGVAEADDRDSLISELRSKGTVLELEEIALGG